LTLTNPALRAAIIPRRRQCDISNTPDQAPPPLILGEDANQRTHLPEVVSVLASDEERLDHPVGC
jgi:hypothetical protein